MAFRFSDPLALLFLAIPLLAVLVWRPVAWSYERRRRRWILGTRLALFTLLVLALAGTELRLPVNHEAVAFVVDLSDSARPARGDALSWVEKALEARGSDDLAGIVVFGRDPLVEEPLTAQRFGAAFNSKPVTTATDLASALRLAAGVLPGRAQKRIVVLSDGRQTAGDALTEAVLLAKQGIRVDVFPLTVTGGPEVLLRSLEAPSSAHEGEVFSLTVTADSTVRTSGTLRVYSDGRLLAEQRVQLSVGTNRYTVTVKETQPGFHTYRATVEAASDTWAQNNEAWAFVDVSGKPRVLVVEGHPGAGANVAAALRAGGVEVDVRPVSGAPQMLPELTPYSAVWLADTAYADLGPDLPAALKTYVSDMGRGLVTSGGEESYGPGGWRNTPLEDALPVQMDVKARGEDPTLALVLVIDKSGSMSEGDGLISKVDLAKEAAIRSTQVLTEKDQIGVVAFDSEYKWVVPLQKVTSVSKIQDLIGTIRADGGTNIYPALDAAYGALVDAKARYKHIILMTDGMSGSGGDYDALAAEMEKAGITMSTVAVGGDADRTLLEHLAKVGGGRYYFTDQLRSIPKIFTKETVLATRNYFVEENFRPMAGAPSPVLRGVDEVASLSGYVATTLKPNAEAALLSARGEPVLATWQYGLGRAAAWTSDAAGRWTQAWLAWSGSARLWQNTLSWVLPTPSTGGWEVRSEIVGGAGSMAGAAGAAGGTGAGGAGRAAGAAGGGIRKLVVETSNESQLSKTGPATAHVVGPDGMAFDVPLTLTGPGRYEGTMPVDQPGAYMVKVIEGAGGAGGATLAAGGYVSAYSAEYLVPGTDKDFLTNLARSGQGAVLAAQHSGDVAGPEGAFARNLAKVWDTRSLSLLFLAFAALLLPFDVAARRLYLSSEDVAEIKRRVEALVPWRRRKAEAELAAREQPVTVTRLRTRREKAGPRVINPGLSQISGTDRATSARTPGSAPASASGSASDSARVPSSDPAAASGTQRRAAPWQPATNSERPASDGQPVSGQQPGSDHQQVPSHQAASGERAASGEEADSVSRLLEAKRRRR